MFNQLASNPFRFVFLLGLIGTMTPSWAITEKTSDWHWRAPIIMAAQLDGKEFAKIQINEAIFDASKADLSDIRVIGPNDERIPHHLLSIESSYPSSEQWLDHNLINHVYDPQQFQQVTIDFSNSQLKSELKVTLSDQDYYRRVQIEGSHDLANWQLISNNQILADIQAQESYRQDAVQFPENNFRYLRLTVFQMPDHVTPFSIQSVVTRKQLAASLPVLPVAISSQQVTQDSKNNTVIELDLGYKNLPLSTISLDFLEARYYRGYKVEGKNSLVAPPQNVARTQPTLPPEWSLISRGVFYRTQNSDGSESVQNQINLYGQPSFRHLKITILNQDNPAINIASAQVQRTDRWVIFPTTTHPEFLLYGNPKATSAQYDLIKSYPNLEKEAMDVLTLGTAERLAPSSDPLPWSESNKWLLGLILLICAVFLGYGIFRQLKRPLSTP